MSSTGGYETSPRLLHSGTGTMSVPAAQTEDNTEGLRKSFILESMEERTIRHGSPCNEVAVAHLVRPNGIALGVQFFHSRSGHVGSAVCTLELQSPPCDYSGVSPSTTLSLF